MGIDPDNPIVKLCVEGMRAEGDGRLEQARALFQQAWDASRDDYEACIAAHYLARHQPTPQDTLEWNKTALKRAQAVGDERVEGFYPSLYLNLGHSCEMVGNMDEAREYYRKAEELFQILSPGRYAGIVQQGIENGLKRTGQEGV